MWCRRAASARPEASMRPSPRTAENRKPGYPAARIGMLLIAPPKRDPVCGRPEAPAEQARRLRHGRRAFKPVRWNGRSSAAVAGMPPHANPFPPRPKCGTRASCGVPATNAAAGFRWKPAARYSDRAAGLLARRRDHEGHATLDPKPRVVGGEREIRRQLRRAWNDVVSAAHVMVRAVDS